ncbi:related to protein involved in cell growth [Phialocephala subalpina]|uniref:Related to protein involved in cell growth n=1 Tax=Phialocephala subalpina TaxID=576137 RepID=A0A1L7WNZ6_9HELO|nr:related to protein involved in cell growth [Phialocephala subalpina]
MSSVSGAPSHARKRLVLCCDGTWMDSDNGFQKPTLIPYVPTGSLQVPSNVTRIARALKRTGLDGMPQIIYYHSGVGTGSTILDAITGGLMGTGISENIREVYSFIVTNYTPGDEIVLIGFSRGAFTVRSVAGIISDIGLLTREGMNDFYPIFKDQENFKNDRYHDIFPTIPFSNKPRGEDSQAEYKRRLEKVGLTRVYDPDGRKIRIQSVAVWDTVGSLGIPQIAILAKLGLPHSTKEYKFYDTNLTDNILHAFQALALDEHRAPFNAAVWERKDHKDLVTTDLRQCWFPGAHSNVGGGYDDQEIANISLAWMMDQLASIGVAFQDEYIDKIFEQNVQYYENPPKAVARRPPPQWAISEVYDKHKPVRPWGLGKIWNSETGLYRLTGKKWRTPGLTERADPDSGMLTGILMRNTNERIHSCVRVRLDLGGLGLDDKGPYKCHALLDKDWELRQIRINVHDPIPWNATWGPSVPPADHPQDDLRWVWEYNGPERLAPRERIMIEEPLGPYERKLLLLNKGRKYYKTVRKRRKRKSRRESEYDRGQFTTTADRDAADSLIEDGAYGRRNRDLYPERRRRGDPEKKGSRIIETEVEREYRSPPPREKEYVEEDEIVVIEEHSPPRREHRRHGSHAGSRAPSRAPSRIVPLRDGSESDVVVITEEARREDRQRYSEKMNERFKKVERDRESNGFRDEGYEEGIGAANYRDDRRRRENGRVREVERERVVREVPDGEFFERERVVREERRERDGSRYRGE